MLMLGRVTRAPTCCRAPALRVAAAALPRRLCATATATPAASAAPVRSVVGELERLESESPWWKATFLKLGGVFSDEQWQAAAGSDMYVSIASHARAQQSVLEHRGAVPDRFYTRLQLCGLHCWLAHVRLRAEPKERFATLYREMMEKVWQQAELDLTRDFQMGYVQMAKHIKAAQFAWHGLCKNLDEALESGNEPRDAMAAVLLRNVYVWPDPSPVPSPSPCDGKPMLRVQCICALITPGSLTASHALCSAPPPS